MRTYNSTFLTKGGEISVGVGWKSECYIRFSGTGGNTVIFCSKQQLSKIREQIEQFEKDMLA